MKAKQVSAILFIILFVNSLVIYSCNKNTHEADTYLYVTPSSLAFDNNGGSQDVEINTDGSWTITNTVDWCLVSSISGKGDALITVTVEPNESGNELSTTIKVNTSNFLKSIEVNISGGDTLFVTYDIPPDNTDMRDLTSNQLAPLMGVGWNVGNSLDAIGGETAWGNPLITQRLLDSVKAAGFNCVRIPVAWSKFSDEENFIIDQSWLERVEEVVNYVLNNNMYAIVNLHWDGGWMQPTYAQKDYVNNRLEIMWKQIATHFRDYNDYLLFAGSNEVLVDGDYGTPTVEYYTVQNSFNQTFVKAVRETGGRNAYRHLVVQGFNTNIDFTVSYADIPNDAVQNRLFMEVHYYDPYDFTINESSSVTQWGEDAEDPDKTAGWGNETWADQQFQKMKTNFIDKGIAVILGEYGGQYRNNADGNHEEYRRHYTAYITQSIVNHQLVPIWWDNGYTGLYGMGIFYRSTGAQAFSDIVEAIVSALD